ncbi:MAG: fimbrillin family protein [Bacteroides sp.]|nr:fimbrillin family protein [Bacteroides sp.]
MKKIVMFGAAALALTACSSEDVVNPGTVREHEPGEISFRARLVNSTRGMDIVADDLTQFMVAGLKGLPEDVADGKITEMTSHFDWTEFSKEASAPYRFYPEKVLRYPFDNTMLYMPAYAPVEAQFTDVETPGDGGIVFKGFAVDEDIEQQLDLIVGEGVGRYTESDEYNSIDFQHILTKVYVASAKNEDSDLNYEVIGIRFGNIYLEGDGQFRTAAIIDEDGNPIEGADASWQNDAIMWETQGDLATITYRFSDPVTIGSDDTALMDGGAGAGSFLMIPQQATFTTVAADEAADDEEGPVDANTGGTLKFKEGMSYIALLIRLTNTTGDCYYPFPGNKGVQNITESIGGVEYAWAAFPIASRWKAGTTTIYKIDFTEGAGYVAPGAEGYKDDFLAEDGDVSERPATRADEENWIDTEYRPILGTQIRFDEIFVRGWDEADSTEETTSQRYVVTLDEGSTDDPFAE